MARILSLVAVATILLVGASSGAQQPPLKKSKLTAQEITAILNTPVALKDFGKPMTLKEGIGLLYERTKSKTKELAVVVNQIAFQEENPDAPDIYEALVEIKSDKKELAAGKLLALMLTQVQSNNATYVVRQGYVEITTLAQAKNTKKAK